MVQAKILLGLSGGPDSVYLFHELLEKHTKGEIILSCAHVNHGWRGEDSNRDQIFCEKLCDEHDIKLYTAHADHLIEELPEHKKNIKSPEAQARFIRRLFFEQLAHDEQFERVYLAHNQDDQLENFFIRLARGSSLAGLSGIKTDDKLYTRPLLNTPKKLVLENLERKNIAYCSDETNSDARYLRNNIRENLIPVIEQIEPRMRNNILSTIHKLAEENSFLESLTHDIVMSAGENGKYNLVLFRGIPPVLQKRVLCELLIQNKIIFTPSESFFDEVIKFIESPDGGSHQISPEDKVIKKSKFFWFEKQAGVALLYH